MNNTLNNLALHSFNRKARKIGSNIEVINCMDIFFIPYCTVHAGETLFIWSEENGFHSIFTENDKELAYLVDFPEKYGYDSVYHFAILNLQAIRLALPGSIWMFADSKTMNRSGCCMAWRNFTMSAHELLAVNCTETER